MIMEQYINKNILNALCIKIGEQIGLPLKNLHIAAVFENNSSDEVIGWAVLDGNNNIVKRYEDLRDLYNDYETNKR